MSEKMAEVIEPMEVLTPPLAQAALEFISRANLIGKEVSVFTEVANALAEIASGKVVVVAATLPADHTAAKLEICEVQTQYKTLEHQLRESIGREKDLTMKLARAQTVLDRVVAATDSPKVRKQRLVDLARELRGVPVTATVAK